ncbi:MAG: DUF3754 domain-containing protein [Pseudomonadales bacterium]|nr:DUF3754 domain-containing protein [Pseudomonadales bacterium]
MRFREVCRLLQSVFHFEYHDNLEALKDAYAPLNPDRDTRKVGVFTGAGQTSFVDQLALLLDKANYEKLSDDALQQAFDEASLFRLKLDVDFDAFEEVLLFVRGESTRTEIVRRYFGLYRKEIEFVNFDRVVIYIRFRDDSDLRMQKPGSTLLKLFQNVPKADVEMLFPNTRVGMRAIDKLMIGVPAVLGGGIVLTTKLGTSLVLLGALVGFWLGLRSQPVELDEAALLGLVAGLGALGSFIWKQFVNFKTRKLTFMQALTQNLYFRNLDNNAGVFHRLIDDAEEEECKEAILAYYFLLTSTERLNEQALDREVERWFAERWATHLDFEVDDALRKLMVLGLAKRDADGMLHVVDLDEACTILDRRWDEYFSFE